jgi:predicted aldo/keto reductase-like oxidoreductase
VGDLKGEMLYRKLGKTGATVSAIGFGGSHFAKAAIDEGTSVRLLHAAIDRGITFMDNSWDYNEGQSEIRMGKGLSQGGYREKVFLMTKLDGRTKEVAEAQINTSLERLKTDHIDLLMHHEVLRFDDADRVFDEGGAHEAVLAAQKAGKVRFVGFTGHKDPHVHLYMLDVAQKHGKPIDAVLMPMNVMDAHFRSFARLVLPRLVKEQIGVLSMKPLGGGDGIILKSGTVQALECLHYALNLPTNVVITGIDKQEVLEQAVQAAKTFKAMSKSQVQAILDKTAAVARTGRFELNKTTSHFDTTARHPDWLGGDNAEVKKLAPESAG